MAKFISTKAQVWYLDFVIGALLFVGVLTVFFIQVQGIENPEAVELASVFGQARELSNELLTTGSPADWNQSNVLRIGLAENNRINQSKLGSLLQINYAEARKMLRVTDDFYFFIEKEGCLAELNGGYGYGNPQVSVAPSPCATSNDIDLSALDVDNLVQVTRLVIYNATPAKLTAYVWD